ncbi:hypothetical protein L1987_53868 [Smallanthus sonchifolius]|uniref:Uncharacterized protein n=1 Tax=Smallanthus sonchifolius TaxID=185202 RepID=A0ACB9EX70_9ASTR|nr:hypothetical protein L1987_53868 [Smallanthus sonchifolius]
MKENSNLISSIMGMPRSRVTKFSAKVNDDGRITIDENMIDTCNAGAEFTLDPLTHQTMSYANKVSGLENTSGLEKVRFYPPTISDDGHTFASWRSLSFYDSHGYNLGHVISGQKTLWKHGCMLEFMYAWWLKKKVWINPWEKQHKIKGSAMDALKLKNCKTFLHKQGDNLDIQNGWIKHCKVRRWERDWNGDGRKRKDRKQRSAMKGDIDHNGIMLRTTQGWNDKHPKDQLILLDVIFYVCVFCICSICTVIMFRTKYCLW